MTTASPADLVQRAATFSRWLAARLQARPELEGWLGETLGKAVSRAEMAEFLATGIACEDDLNRQLRRLREKVFARVMVRDLGGLANLAEVTGTLTMLAEEAVNTAMDFHHKDLAAIHGEPLDAQGRPQRLMVVGMGKLGGG
jgi:glutamate-ammonia-ligase adenylyltransferase